MTVLNQRRAGILLHITSLPSTLGLGSLGKHAFRFVDFLKSCDLSVWQVLPIHPLHQVPKDTPFRDFLSPYQPMSMFAGNPMLINIQRLIDKGWLPRMILAKDTEAEFRDVENNVDLEKVFQYRRRCLKNAYQHFSKYASQEHLAAYGKFIEHNVAWLEDYALFCALKEFYSGACWWNWTEEKYRNYDKQALKEFSELAKQKKYCIEQYYFEQFSFFTQWHELKEYAHQNGVYLFGDMPFFVARDSVEVWAHRDYFLLNDKGIPTVLSGVSPQDDYFYPDKGQCWGNPLYDWKKLEEDSFQWWVKRFELINDLFDIARLTYFEGFHRCWAIPYDGQTNPDPVKGEEKVSGEGRRLFTHLQLMNLPKIVTDDIGAPKEVIDLRKGFKFSGIKLLQLAFNHESKLTNYHLPHKHLPRDAIYTGTHDSNTLMGWFEHIHKIPGRETFVYEYLGMTPEKFLWDFIKAAFQSVAHLAIVPMQDILGLGIESRMNSPKKTSKRSQNWRWQLDWSNIPYDVQFELKKLVERYERK